MIMRRPAFAAALLLCSLLSVNAFSQSTNATLGGTIQDASRAFIPGVTVTATNTGTGVVASVVSNEAGVYQFASLQPGTYDIKAELPGFQTAAAKSSSSAARNRLASISRWKSAPRWERP